MSSHKATSKLGASSTLLEPMNIDAADRRLQQALKECHNARSGHMGAEAQPVRQNLSPVEIDHTFIITTLEDSSKIFHTNTIFLY